MTDTRWERLSTVFDAAIQIDTRDRQVFLEQACGGDPALRADVERLLAAHERADDFIAASPAPSLVPQLLAHDPSLAAARDREAQRVGAYRLVQEIGRGGMGAVYLAERSDSEYRRRVAIKLIKRGMDTDAVLARFRTERQILASLDHPHIARLLDGGTTEDGLPYFVMEYVEGVPIDDYADAKELSVVERLELFLRVCDAVSYAHQRLVIHRDIKPLNILVTPEGVPKLLDFGIAKLVAADDVGASTLTGMTPLTPEYASPEQVQGLRAATTSDVYSLGVVLFELLTGRLPYRFRSRTAEDVIQTITTADPDRPSAAVVEEVEPGIGENGTSSQRRITPPAHRPRTRDANADRLRRRLRGDLDTIVLTALRKEPDRRYASVDQFADDIRRHLAGRPVRAHPDTMWYRATKFVRRNRLAVAAALTLVAALAAGVAATAWQAAAARRQAQRAESRFVFLIEKADVGA